MFCNVLQKEMLSAGKSEREKHTEGNKNDDIVCCMCATTRKRENFNYTNGKIGQESFHAHSNVGFGFFYASDWDFCSVSRAHQKNKNITRVEISCFFSHSVFLFLVLKL